MNVSDTELRAMVRDAIARHTHSGEPVPEAAPDAVPDAASLAFHASRVRLPLASGDSDGACLIEPAVRCNHCGYCLSYGH